MQVMFEVCRYFTLRAEIIVYITSRHVSIHIIALNADERSGKASDFGMPRPI